MPRVRTDLEAAAGKLISAIQTEWGLEAGRSEAEAAEEVMNSAHDLPQAAKLGSVTAVTAGRTVREFLGRAWVEAHPAVLPFIQALESAENRGADA